MTPTELRAARLDLKLTQRQLAEKLGRHRMTVSRWERRSWPIPRAITLAIETLVRGNPR